MQIDISKYIEAAKTRTEKDADILLRAYLEDLITTREATIDEVAKAYGKYLDGVDSANYVIEMNKAGRMDKLIDRVMEIQAEGERRRDKYLENQARVGTNQYYYMMFIYAAFGVMFEDMDDATYYAIIGRDPSAKIKIDGKTWTVGDYIKETVKDKAKRDEIYRDFFASTGGSTIDKIVTINARHRDAIESIIRNGIMSGKSMKEIGTLLKKQFDTTKYIGDRIAKTESKRAYEASQWDAHNEAKAQGIETVRIWHATRDGNTRDQSASMDGQEQDADGLFHYPNGAVGRYPGDSGVAKYDIHERCWVGEYVEGDTISDTMASRDVTAVSASGQALKSANLSTAKGFQTFDEWRKDQGITRNRYGELYSSRT